MLDAGQSMSQKSVVRNQNNMQQRFFQNNDFCKWLCENMLIYPLAALLLLPPTPQRLPL
jgi:hypothetical protein